MLYPPRYSSGPPAPPRWYTGAPSHRLQSVLPERSCLTDVVARSTAAGRSDLRTRRQQFASTRLNVPKAPSAQPLSAASAKPAAAAPAARTQREHTHRVSKYTRAYCVANCLTRRRRRRGVSQAADDDAPLAGYMYRDTMHRHAAMASALVLLSLRGAAEAAEVVEPDDDPLGLGALSTLDATGWFVFVLLVACLLGLMVAPCVTVAWLAKCCCFKDRRPLLPRLPTALDLIRGNQWLSCFLLPEGEYEFFSQKERSFNLAVRVAAFSFVAFLWGLPFSDTATQFGSKPCDTWLTRRKSDPVDFQRPNRDYSEFCNTCVAEPCAHQGTWYVDEYGTGFWQLQPGGSGNCNATQLPTLEGYICGDELKDELLGHAAPSDYCDSTYGPGWSCRPDPDRADDSTVSASWDEWLTEQFILFFLTKFLALLLSTVSGLAFWPTVARRSATSDETPWYDKAFVVYLGCWAIAVAVYSVWFLQSGMLPPDMTLRYLEYHIIDFLIFSNAATAVKCLLGLVELAPTDEGGGGGDQTVNPVEQANTNTVCALLNKYKTFTS